MEANAVVEPDAVVVELLNAHVAHGTVLRTRWFINLASSALVLLVKYNFIVLKSLNLFSKCSLGCSLSHMPGTNITSHKVSEVAGHHYHCTYYFMVASSVVVGDMVESIKNVDVEPAKSTCEVHQLDDWISFPADVAYHPVHHAYSPISTSLFAYGPEAIRQLDCHDSF